MDRSTFNQMMSSAKYKPGDLVWTNVKTYSPWPGKILNVSDEILKLYPHGKKTKYYVELFMKKERDFLPEDELWAFEDGQRTFSVKKRSPLFHQAVAAAKEDAMGLSGSSEMDVDDSAFSVSSNLRSASVGHEKLQSKSVGEASSSCPISCDPVVSDFDPTVMKPSKFMSRKPSSKVDLIPPRRRSKRKATAGKFQNKDLNSEDIYEFTESEPLVLNPGKRIKVESASETKIKSEPSSADANIGGKIPKLEDHIKYRLRPKRAPVDDDIKRKIPKRKSGRSAEPETSDKSFGKIIPKEEPMSESKVDEDSAPLDIKGKIPKVEKIAVSKRGRKSRKRRSTKRKTRAVAAQGKKANDQAVRGRKLNDRTARGKKVRGQTFEQVKVKEQVGECSEESDVIQVSTRMHLTPEMIPPYRTGKKTIGFLGLGGLGKKIVKRLLSNGHEVTIWNRSLYKCYEMLERGVHTRCSAEQVVGSCDVTFCCVTDTTAVKEIFYAPKGAINGIRKGKCFVVLTTIEPTASLDIENDVISKGGHYLEAPVFPAKGDVSENFLMTAVAGDKTCLRACVPFFCSFIKDLYYAGQVPEGNQMILVMKTLGGLKVAALAECLTLARRCDVPTDILFHIIRNSPLASPFLISKGEAMLQLRPWSSDEIFPLAHFSNDLSSILNFTTELDTPVIAATKQVYVHSKALGYRYHDVSALYSRYTKR